MSVTTVNAVAARLPRRWIFLGLALLVYAVLGNYLVLPGYKRFLEHGSPNAGAGGIDFALIWGASRTILWMFSFHLGAFCLAYAALLARGDAVRPFRRWFVGGTIVWLVFWAVPALPGPYTGFFAATGIFILTLIVAMFWRLRQNGARHGSYFGPFRSGEWQIASYFFFALATWDICGLGSIGGILHPAGEVRAASQTLVVAQTTKLILELAIAWGLATRAAFPGRSGMKADRFERG
jgi:hypothetical protein